MTQPSRSGPAAARRCCARPPRCARTPPGPDRSAPRTGSCSRSRRATRRSWDPATAPFRRRRSTRRTAPLHQELGVGVVRIRIVRDQLDVLLEGRLGVVQLVEEAIGVAKLVVGLREGGVDRRRPDELLDRGVVVLPSEVEVAEQRVCPLIVREEPDQFFVVRQHFLDVPFHRCIEAEHHVLLALAHPPGQCRGAGDRVDEFPGRARGVGQAEMRQREVGIFCDCLLVELPCVRRPQLLGQFPALRIQVARFARRRRDGHLVGGGRPGVYA